jgi:ATP-dependent Lon protease
VPPTDDAYFANLNKQLPIGSSNGLAYVNDGYGTLMKIQFVKKFRKPEEEKDDKDKKEKGSGSFTTTGRLGEVFAESVEVVKIAVFNFLHNQGIAKDFDKDSYHLHVPMGATPKDGPSAGVSLFSALVSSATGKPVAANLAMTGEITTLGEVISIGGVREKLTACKNHNITRVVLPISNRKHVKKLPEEFKKGFTIYYI